MKHFIKPFLFFFLILGLLLSSLALLPSHEAYANPIVDMTKPDVEDDAIADGQGITQTKDITITGVIDGANFEIKIPAGWNNDKLVVYAHGYSPKTVPGQVDQAHAGPGGDDLDEELLSMGYAVAGSGFRSRGWAVEEGISDTLALTNHFSQTFGAPSRTILWGLSMGSVIAFSSIERYPDVYHGAIPMCAVGAGSSMTWDSALAFALAYDVTFDWPDEWGDVGDVRDNIRFGTSVLEPLNKQVTEPDNRPEFEFIRLLAGLPEENFYSFPGGWIYLDMFFTTEGRAELERRAGGPVAQNKNHIYSLSDEDKEYLREQGLKPDPDVLLAKMNSETKIEADPDARSYVERNADYTGDITRPVLTLHTTKDGLVIVANETVYSETVAAAGKSDLLYQVYTDDVGHCTFSDEQLKTTLVAMDNWLDDIETPPTEGDFPTDLGFTHDFDPPAWPIMFRNTNPTDDPTNVSLTEFNQPSVPNRAWLPLLPMLIALAGFSYLRRRKRY